MGATTPFIHSDKVRASLETYPRVTHEELAAFFAHKAAVVVLVLFGPPLKSRIGGQKKLIMVSYVKRNTYSQATELKKAQ